MGGDRRRHTRSLRDWSSDVCSSDLGPTYTDRFGSDPQIEADKVSWLTLAASVWAQANSIARYVEGLSLPAPTNVLGAADNGAGLVRVRSEERRVGKECGYGWRQKTAYEIST